MKYDRTDGWFNADDFYFNKIIESHYDLLRKECDYLVNNNLFYPHSQSNENQKTVSTNPSLIIANKWNVFDVAHAGMFTPQAQKYVPKTVEILSRFPEVLACKKGKIYYSMIPENAKVAPHYNLLKPNERHRHQLCLVNVDGADAFIEVNGDRRTWIQGKIISFDDAYRHHVENNSPYTRIVLIYDTVEIGQ